MKANPWRRYVSCLSTLHKNIERPEILKPEVKSAMSRMNRTKESRPGVIVAESEQPQRIWTQTKWPK